MKEKLNDVLNNVAGTLATQRVYVCMYIHMLFFLKKKGLMHTSVELDSP